MKMLLPSNHALLCVLRLKCLMVVNMHIPAWTTRYNPRNMVLNNDQRMFLCCRLLWRYSGGDFWSSRYLNIMDVSLLSSKSFVWEKTVIIRKWIVELWLQVCFIGHSDLDLWPLFTKLKSFVCLYLCRIWIPSKCSWGTGFLSVGLVYNLSDLDFFNFSENLFTGVSVKKKWHPETEEGPTKAWHLVFLLVTC